MIAWAWIMCWTLDCIEASPWASQVWSYLLIPVISPWVTKFCTTLMSWYHRDVAFDTIWIDTTNIPTFDPSITLCDMPVSALLNFVARMMIGFGLLSVLVPLGLLWHLASFPSRLAAWIRASADDDPEQSLLAALQLLVLTSEEIRKFWLFSPCWNIVYDPLAKPLPPCLQIHTTIETSPCLSGSPSLSIPNA
jgi:hypothetical protein